MDDARDFAEEFVAPHAADADECGYLNEGVIRSLAEGGWLGSAVSQEHGGVGLSPQELGVLCEELGRACSATRSLLTVHSMVAVAIERWGTSAQKEKWLPEMAMGSRIAALALTEPEAGSDASSVAATARVEGDEIVVSGSKSWVTAGLRADWLLVVARATEGPTAVLVPTKAEGIKCSAVVGSLGLRGASLGHFEFSEVRAPITSIVGRPGTGVSHVASTALDHGRFTVAWGCVGMGQSCLEACATHAAGRIQYGKALGGHQLVRAKLGEMATDVSLARLQCAAAARLRAERSPVALIETIRAKYAAAEMVQRVASHAVQIHGAAGCALGHPVERHYRDAKVMQIIEGTQGLLSLTLGEHALRRAARR